MTRLTKSAPQKRRIDTISQSIHILVHSDRLYQGADVHRYNTISFFWSFLHTSNFIVGFQNSIYFHFHFLNLILLRGIINGLISNDCPRLVSMYLSTLTYQIISDFTFESRSVSFIYTILKRNIFP